MRPPSAGRSSPSLHEPSLHSLPAASTGANSTLSRHERTLPQPPSPSPSPSPEPDSRHQSVSSTAGFLTSTTAAPPMASVYDHANYPSQATDNILTASSSSKPSTSKAARTSTAPRPTRERHENGPAAAFAHGGGIDNIGTGYDRYGSSAVPPTGYADVPLAANGNTHTWGRGSAYVENPRYGAPALDSLGRRPSSLSPSSKLPPPPPHPRRHHGGYCCGCFRTRAGCCGFWWTMVVLLLAGLGIAAFFLWPKVPQVTVSDPYAPTNERAIITSGSLQAATATAPYTVQFNMRTDISVYSPNNVDFKVDKLTFSGVLLDSSNNRLNARANGQQNNVVFKSKQNTTFVFPIVMAYSVTTPFASLDVLARQDPVMSELARSCGWLGAARTPIRMDYTAEASIAWISWTGYRPKFEGRLSFACPVDGTTLTTLLRRAGRGGTVVVDLV
ncbi:hypothetical protein HDU96_010248 [Phlyctochytrium bullatum]|nr:hypothetical protein HDU96_010248 [Phlyctochytrium bullatum]